MSKNLYGKCITEVNIENDSAFFCRYYYAQIYKMAYLCREHMPFFYEVCPLQESNLCVYGRINVISHMSKKLFIIISLNDQSFNHKRKQSFLIFKRLKRFERLENCCFISFTSIKIILLGCKAHSKKSL